MSCCRGFVLALKANGVCGYFDPRCLGNPQALSFPKAKDYFKNVGSDFFCAPLLKTYRCTSLENALRTSDTIEVKFTAEIGKVKKSLCAEREECHIRPGKLMFLLLGNQNTPSKNSKKAKDQKTPMMIKCVK